MRRSLRCVLSVIVVLAVGCTDTGATDPGGTDPTGDPTMPTVDPTTNDNATDGQPTEAATEQDLAAVCDVFATDEIAAYVARGLDANREVAEVPAAVVSSRPSGVECRWAVVIGQCNADGSSCESDVWMQATLYPLDEVLDDDWTAAEGEPTADAIQGSIWFDHDDHRVALHTGFQTISSPEGNPDLIADVLVELMARVRAEL
jgi:hypothetical protein